MTTALGTIKAAAKHMTHGGSVVLLSSVAARVGLANHEAIAAAKAGVVGLALSAAATHVGRDLRVNTVAPGLIQTPLTESVPRSETARQASVDLHPLGRLGEPADVAAMIGWPRSPWEDYRPLNRCTLARPPRSSFRAPAAHAAPSLPSRSTLPRLSLPAFLSGSAASLLTLG